MVSNDFLDTASCKAILGSEEGWEEGAEIGGLGGEHVRESKVGWEEGAEVNGLGVEHVRDSSAMQLAEAVASKGIMMGESRPRMVHRRHTINSGRKGCRTIRGWRNHIGERLRMA